MNRRGFLSLLGIPAFAAPAAAQPSAPPAPPKPAPPPAPPSDSIFAFTPDEVQVLKRVAMAFRQVPLKKQLRLMENLVDKAITEHPQNSLVNPFED